MGCFSSDPVPTTQITSQNLPAYIQTGGQQNLDIATLLGNRPYTTYPAARIAGNSADTNQSFDLIRALTGANGGTAAWQPNLSQATNNVSSMLNTPTDTAAISNFMNPYTSMALQPQIDAINRQGDLNRNRIAAGATNAGAFGGSRHGIVDAENDRNTGIAVNNAVGTGLNNAYNTASSLYGADRSQRLSAAQMLGSLTGQQNQLGLSDAAALSQVGSQEENKTQQNLSLGYQDFLNQQAWPEQMLNLRIAALANTPYNRNSATTGNTYLPNTTAQGLGALAALTGAAGTLSNSGLGSNIGSGLNSAWNWLSA